MSQSEYKYQASHVVKASVHECTASDKESLLASLKKSDKKPDQTLAAEAFDPQKDLLKIVALLVSTGENKNDDVFLSEELVKARASGAHKLLNIEHDVDNIIGHMTHSFLVDKDGNVISDEDLEKNGVPKDFDIMNEAVIYAYAKPEVADAVRKLAAADELFVSVEMWFKDYDFLVGTKIIKRNSATAHLESSLRANGGDGVYREAHVGRVLRDLLIGGEGLVENPANPESVGNTVADLAAASARDVEVYEEKAISDNVIEDLSHKSSANQQDTEEITMKEVLKEMMETAKVSAKIAADEAVKEALKAQESQSDSSQENPSDTNASTAPPVAAPAPEEDTQGSKVENEQISKLQASVEALTKTLEDQSEEIGRLTLKQVVASRREQMRAVGFSNEQVETRIGALTDLSEAEFKERLADYVSLFNELNLRPASASVTDKAEEDDGNGEEQPADNADASENKDDDDDDVLIDMDELTNVDADVNDQGGSAKASNDDLEERYFAAATRHLCGRNKRWRKAEVARKDEESKE